MVVCVPYNTHTVKEKNENLRVHSQLRVSRQKLASLDSSMKSNRHAEAYRQSQPWADERVTGLQCE
jgi:hypothetical protein